MLGQDGHGLSALLAAKLLVVLGRSTEADALQGSGGQGVSEVGSGQGSGTDAGAQSVQ